MCWVNNPSGVNKVLARSKVKHKIYLKKLNYDLIINLTFEEVKKSLTNWFIPGLTYLKIPL